jgi:hypothetical protein
LDTRLDRARLVATEALIYVPTHDLFVVHSDHSDNDYTVSRQGNCYTCDCQAGEKAMVCWHKALVAALPVECERRATNRQALRAATIDLVMHSITSPKNDHDTLMEAFE